MPLSRREFLQRSAAAVTAGLAFPPGAAQAEAANGPDIHDGATALPLPPGPFLPTWDSIRQHYFDNGVNSRAYDPIKLRMAAYYYNRAAKWGKDVTIATKDSAYLAGSALDFEKAGRGPRDILPGAWQIDDQIASNSWGYITDLRYRSAASILSELIDTVSKGGNLLLNISPRADGTIPDEQQQILRSLGAWLTINGEAIYGSRPWTRFADGSFRFTTQGDTLYAIALTAPGASAHIPSLSAGKVTDVRLLGRPAPTRPR